jgi:hypothetical protein
MASAITDFLIRVKVQGQNLVDNLTKSVSNADKTMNKASGTAGKFGKAVSDMGGVVSNSMSSGVSAVDGMANALGGLGRVAGGVALIGTAFIALGMRAVNAADQIQDLSDATGIGAGRLLNFKQSLIEAGGRTEDFEKISAKLNQTLGEAAQGNEKTRKSFKDLGIDLGDANGKLRSTDELLPEILSALSAIDDPATRAATAVDLLGKAANKIDWTKVSAGKDAIKDEQIRQLAEYKGAIDKLANSIETTLLTAFGKLAIAIDQQGAVMGTTGWMDDYLLKFQYWVIELTQGKKAADSYFQSLMKFRGVVGALPSMAPGQQALPPGVSPSQAGGDRGFINPPMAGAGRTGGTGDLAMTDAGKQAVKNAEAQTKALRETNDLQNKYAMRLNDTLGMQQLSGDIARSNLNIDKDRDIKLAEINKQIETELNNKERDSRVTKALVAELREQGMEAIRQADAMKIAKADEITKLQQQKDLMADIALLNSTMVQDVQVKQLGNQNNLIGLYGDELKLKQGLLGIENERVNASLSAENKLRALGKNATTEDQNRANLEIQQAQKVADAKIAILNEQLEKEKTLRNDANAGAKQALEQIARSMDPFVLAQNRVNSMFSNMSSAIDNFVDTGKFSFSDFARSVIQDLIKIELKAQATQLMKGLMGAVGGGGGLFGGAIIPGFLADGGPATAGKPYVVGENGPELFVPKSSGTVIPNGGSTAGASSTQTNVTYNISAIDSRSVAQFFAENRRTMLGTMQLAQKELPYGNR